MLSQRLESSRYSLTLFKVQTKEKVLKSKLLVCKAPPKASNSCPTSKSEIQLRKIKPNKMIQRTSRIIIMVSYSRLGSQELIVNLQLKWQCARDRPNFTSASKFHRIITSVYDKISRKSRLAKLILRPYEKDRLAALDKPNN